jgi:hypothetical protein
MLMQMLMAFLTLTAAAQQAAAPQAAAPATTQKPAQAQAERPERPTPGWVSLFNGKDLTGWVPVGNEKWTVEDGGVIHGEGVTKEYGYLRTEKTYKDFQMTFRFKCEADGNSGVFFHADFKPGSVDIQQGLQFEIDRTLNHHTGGLYGDGRNWIVWPSPEMETILRPYDWNDMHITVIGNRYIARLNGELLVDFTDPTPKSFDGYIALQLHSGGLGNMRFKDLYIRDLTKR